MVSWGKSWKCTEFLYVVKKALKSHKNMQERELCFPIFKELNIFILLIAGSRVLAHQPKLIVRIHILVLYISVMEVLGSLKFKTENSWLS